MITSELMGQTKKAKITFTCTQEARDFLEKWSTSERRTLSNLVEGLIDEAISAKSKPMNPVLTTDKADSKDLNAEDFLRILLSGRLPTDGELIEVATTLGVKAEKLIELRSKLKDKKKTTNG